MIACEPWQSALENPTSVPIWEQDALVVSPGRLDFDTLSLSGVDSQTLGFSISNAGSEIIVVHGHNEFVSLSGDAGPNTFSIDAEPIFELLPGASRTLDVTFSPETESSWHGEVRVNYGIEVLSLYGAATAPERTALPPRRAPAIQINPIQFIGEKTNQPGSWISSRMSSKFEPI